MQKALHEVGGLLLRELQVGCYLVNKLCLGHARPALLGPGRPPG
jgi:hypothetical protein